jgi:hypothetical protein
VPGVARCATCLRVERHDGCGDVRVVEPGGSRRPDVPGPLAAWRTLRRVKAGDLGPPVAACGCGQPMFLVDGDLPALPSFDLVLPGETVRVGPDGRAIGDDDVAVERRIETAFAKELDVRATAGQIGFALALLAIALFLAPFIGVCEIPTIAITMLVAYVATRVRETD